MCYFAQSVPLPSLTVCPSRMSTYDWGGMTRLQTFLNQLDTENCFWAELLTYMEISENYTIM